MHLCATAVAESQVAQGARHRLSQVSASKPGSALSNFKKWVSLTLRKQFEGVVGKPD